jgi:ribosomal protein L15E
MPLPYYQLTSTKPMIFEVLVDNDWRHFLCREYQIPRIARGLESKGQRIRGLDDNTCTIPDNKVSTIETQ